VAGDIGGHVKDLVKKGKRFLWKGGRDVLFEFYSIVSKYGMDDQVLFD
jgi:hypothetical protein